MLGNFLAFFSRFFLCFHLHFGDQNVGIKNASENARKDKKRNASETMHSVIRPLEFCREYFCKECFMNYKLIKAPCT